MDLRSCPVWYLHDDIDDGLVGDGFDPWIGTHDGFIDANVHCESVRINH